MTIYVRWAEKEKRKNLSLGKHFNKEIVFHWNENVWKMKNFPIIFHCSGCLDGNIMNAKSHVNCRVFFFLSSSSFSFWQFIQWIPFCVLFSIKFWISNSYDDDCIAKSPVNVSFLRDMKHTLDNNGINPINYSGTWVFTLKLFSIFFFILSMCVCVLHFCWRKEEKKSHALVIENLWNLCVFGPDISHRYFVIR